jgi:GMP synthase-like glutamine amidotransferase
MLINVLKAVAPDWEYIVYPVLHGEFPSSVNECDGYITTGSRYGVNDDLPWIDQLLVFIREIDQQQLKFVGICFGHQLLAKALGGQVEKSSRGWGVGVSFNHIIDKQRWMSPYQEAMDLVVSHQDQVVELPHNAERLASSQFCPNYMFQIGKHLMGVQGHPEFSRPYSAELMDRRRDRISSSRIREGMNSLQADVDDKLMIQWIVNFFSEA